LSIDAFAVSIGLGSNKDMNIPCITAAFTLSPAPGGLRHRVLTRPGTEPSMRFLSVGSNLRLKRLLSCVKGSDPLIRAGDDFSQGMPNSIQKQGGDVAMKYLMFLEASATGYAAYSIDLPGSVTAGTTREESVKSLKDAIVVPGGRGAPGD
jgi:hypothetical protein